MEALELRVRNIEDRKDAANDCDTLLQPTIDCQRNRHEIHYELSSSKKVTIGVWESQEGPVPLVHLREYKRVKGKQEPTVNGIALTMK